MAEAGADGRLPGDVLAQAGTEHVPEDDFVDSVGRRRRAGQRGLDGDASERGGGDFRQRAGNPPIAVRTAPARNTLVSMGCSFYHVPFTL